MICCGTEAMWRSICAVMGRDDLAEHEEWGRMAWRIEHNDEVDALLEPWTRAHDSADLDRRLGAAGVVASPVRGIEELLRCPQLRARGMIEPVSHPTLGPLPGLAAAGFPLKFSAAETGYEGAAAPLGTHTREILGRLLELDESALDDLFARRIIG